MDWKSWLVVVGMGILGMVLAWYIPEIFGQTGLNIEAENELKPLHFAFDASPDDSVGGDVAEYRVFRAKKPDGFVLADSLAVLRIPATGAAVYRFEMQVGFGNPFWYTVVAVDASGIQSDPCAPVRAVVQEWTMVRWKKKGKRLMVFMERAQ